MAIHCFLLFLLTISQVECLQILEDAKKEKARNGDAIREWQKKHERLELEEIEYVIHTQRLS